MGSETTAACGGVKGAERVAAVDSRGRRTVADDGVGHRNRGARRPPPVAESREPSEWQRSTAEEGAPSPTMVSGTATGPTFWQGTT